MATEIEAQTVRWIAELIGFPAGAGGLLVSGGNMANFVCFLAARRAKAPDVRTARAARTRAPLRVYASTETHTWIQKAADLFGLGTDAIRWIAADADAAHGCRRARAADRRRPSPTAIVRSWSSAPPGPSAPGASIRWRRSPRSAGATTSGSTSTARTARSRRACPARRRACARSSDADSVAVDPHKWLYAPLEAGCALVRRPADLLRAFSYHPSATTTSITR